MSAYVRMNINIRKKFYPVFFVLRRQDVKIRFSPNHWPYLKIKMSRLTYFLFYSDGKLITTEKYHKKHHVLRYWSYKNLKNINKTLWTFYCLSYSEKYFMNSSNWLIFFLNSKETLEIEKKLSKRTLRKTL